MFRKLQNLIVKALGKDDETPVSHEKLSTYYHQNRNKERYLIQIGAGAGDQDNRANYHDGFSEIIKRLALDQKDRIVLVEPNPLNIDALKKCWEGNPKASIHQIGIVTKALAGKPLPFYYTELDAPCYQIASFNPDHVLKHYKKLTLPDLTVIPVQTIDLEAFIASTTNGKHIALLALDIEGLDAEVILDTNFRDMNVDMVSFEHLHLGAQKQAVADHFKKAGFGKIGGGIDHNGYDHLYRKKEKL